MGEKSGASPKDEVLQRGALRASAFMVDSPGSAAVPRACCATTESTRQVPVICTLDDIAIGRLDFCQGDSHSSRYKRHECRYLPRGISCAVRPTRHRTTCWQRCPMSLGSAGCGNSIS